MRAGRLAQLENGILTFSEENTPLIGAQNPVARATLAKQMIASLRRLDYTTILKGRDIHPDRANPASELFDPERAALFQARHGHFDEAIWLVFLSIHFGKHKVHGWRRVRDIYSGMGSGTWTWARASAQPSEFRNWLNAIHSSIGGAFGNHRKYETLNPGSRSSTSAVIESFVALIGPSPTTYFAALTHSTGNDPKAIFDAAYNQLNIIRFGRLAKFDFLALLGRMDLAPLQPGSAYLRGATGPLRGARLLVDGDPDSASTPDTLDHILQELDLDLGVGMQVMEDAICNWQKSPQRFIHFRG